VNPVRGIPFGVQLHRLLNSDPHRKLAPEVVLKSALRKFAGILGLTA
jgi:hypothetical protein